MTAFKKLFIGSLPFSFHLLSTAVYAQGVPLNIPAPPNLRVTDLGRLISGAIGAILVVTTLAAFIYLLLGGFQWITSGGDKAGVEAAQKRIQAAIIGLFVVFAAWALSRGVSAGAIRGALRCAVLFL